MKESLSRQVRVEDGVSSSLELLPILEAERMRELLAEALSARGFVRDGQRAVRKEASGITVEIGLESGEVTVVAEGHRRVEAETRRSGMATEQESVVAKEAGLREAARAQLEVEAAAEEASLQKEVTERLEGHLRALREELDGVVNRVTAEALKQRAAELGEVQAVREGADGSLTITVKV